MMILQELHDNKIILKWRSDFRCCVWIYWYASKIYAWHIRKV